MAERQADAASAAATGNTASDQAPIDQDALSLEDLARAVLDRQLRPRVGSVRRLAEGVLARAEPAPKPAAGKKKKSAKAKKAADKKAGGKKRKQAKIPGQKGA